MEYAGRNTLNGMAAGVNGSIAAVGRAAAVALDEMAARKADRPLSGSVAIKTSSWAAEPGGIASYPYYCDIAVSGVTANDHADVVIAPASMDVAVSCGICPSCQTVAGKIRLRAAAVPTASITVGYEIRKG